MMSSIKKITNEIEIMRKHFGWDKSDTPQFLVDCVLEEAQELKDAYESKDKEAISNEIADVFMYLITLANELDLDIFEIIHKKRLEVMTRQYD